MEGVRPHQRVEGMITGGSLDEEQVNISAEGCSGPNRKGFNDDTEVGGDRGDDEDKEDCQGPEHDPPANRAQTVAAIAQ